MADRKGRVKSLLHKNLSDILSFGLKNPHVGFVSLNRCDVSDDYSHIRAYVSFLGAKYPRQNLAELNRLKGVVRSQLSKKMDLRKVPEVSFYLDETMDKALSLEEALKREEEDLERFKGEGE